MNDIPLSKELEQKLLSDPQRAYRLICGLIRYGQTQDSEIEKRNFKIQQLRNECRRWKRKYIKLSKRLKKQGIVMEVEDERCGL